MAHNQSPSKLRSDVLGAPLEIYRGWQIQAECGQAGCPAGRAYRVETLARLYPGCTVGEAVNRLRCASCGTGPRDVAMAEVFERRRVPLRGAGCQF